MAALNPKPWVLCLTGGIGSGKSTVAKRLGELGATVVDADALARACTLPGGSAIAAIAATFGADMLTPEGAMDRDRMRQRVFSDPQARTQLESIIHPQVRLDIAQAVAQAQTRVVVLDLPLLAESAHWRQGLDWVWVVDCDPETQIQRVMLRNGWSRAQVQAVLAAQASREQRLAMANVVIDNGAQQTLKHLLLQVDSQWQAMWQRFGL